MVGVVVLSFPELGSIANRVAIVVGMVLIIGTFTLVLLPFSIASLQAKGWESPVIISMLVVGCCCGTSFLVWERYFAKVCFAPFHLLLDRLVAGACLLTATVFLSF